MVKHSFAYVRMIAAFSLIGLLAACDGPPSLATAPTAAPLARSLASTAPKAAPTVTFVKDQVGRALIENNGTAHTFTLIDWDTTDPANQEDTAHTLPVAAKPGEKLDLFVSVYVHPLKGCVKYQPDVYMDLPQADRYTIADVSNYFLAAPGVLSQTNGACDPIPVCPPQCGSTPPPCPGLCDPPIHIDPPCSALAFASRNRWKDVVAGFAYELVDVKPEYDGIKVWFISWGVPGHFFQQPGGGLFVPSPQTKLPQSFSQVLHTGLTQLQIALSDRAVWPAYQTEFGCQDAPALLTNTDISGSYLDFTFGNYDEDEVLP